MSQNDERRTKNAGNQIKHFTDLRAWQEGRQLVVLVYELSERFPAGEQFGLTTQMKRASISVTSNITEGFKRDSMKDKIRFYVMAHGSLSEVQNQLYVALDVHYIDEPTFESVYIQAEIVDKLLTGLIKASKERM